MGGSLCLRVMPQAQAKSEHWLLLFLARCTKTKPNQKLEPRPLDKEHPVGWRHSTSGGLMLLLSNAWPGGHCHFMLNKSPGGKLTFERDQKASSCDAKAPSPVSLESGSMWTAQTWAHEAVLRHSLPASVPKTCAKTRGISQHLSFPISALPRFPSTSGLKYQSRWRDN